MLTKKQRDLLLFIHDRLQNGGVSPSFDEMKDALGLKSKSGIHRLISALEERGYIERLAHRARALEIKKLPDGLLANTLNETVPQSAPLKPEWSHNPASEQTLSIPLYGKIAAGTPIEALCDEGQTLPMPTDFLGHGEHYALSVEGDSMINAGIHDQDLVIIQRCERADNGTIVVALVRDHEATLKRLRKSGSKIILEPENDHYEPQMLDPEDVKIQGRLVGLLRTYH